jgi:tRNA intron endonuclease, N-terminal domain
MTMLPIQKKSRVKVFNVKPFPSEITAIGYFTGLDVEIFDEASIKTIYESGCYGLNPKPRQALKHKKQQNPATEVELRREEEWRGMFGDPATDETPPIPFNIPQSLVLFLEEAFFLQHTINCLEIRDLDDRPIPTEELWTTFCSLKETFVECFVAYLYLKSKNWLIKSGMKFGGEFCK